MKASTIRIISLCTLAAIWEIAGRTGNAHLLPPLSKVAIVWVELLVSGQLLQAIAISFQALVIGFFVSLVGVPLGLMMGHYRRLESFLEIYMTALLAVPMISFIPFLVIAFGLGLHSRVWIVFLFAFVIIVINTTAGVRNVDPTLTEMARSFGARESELFLKVILPAAMPMTDGHSPRDGPRGARHGDRRDDSRRRRFRRPADDVQRIFQFQRALRDHPYDRFTRSRLARVDSILRSTADAVARRVELTQPTLCFLFIYSPRFNRPPYSSPAMRLCRNVILRRSRRICFFVRPRKADASLSLSMTSSNL